MLSNLISRFRMPIILALCGLLLTGLGVLISKSGLVSSPTKVEILSDEKVSGEVVVEVAGGVEKPGVYKLPNGSRIEDGLIVAGGLSATADREWVDKTINRAAKLIDGQKIFIKQLGVLSAKNEEGGQTITPSFSTPEEGLTNINTADAKTLDLLPGIGPVYAQKITEQRPYSTVEELLSKKVIPAATYAKIKNLITVY